ncbi:hypothetical protein LVD15_21835 [Fulvivirga maritima]|uniref:hypothetical protein n=1 Tax=Fulvivirga maritima TaxID=2904247 RepID=UPI001F261AA9|nr:hypothetical protein [Fulvivirga maritima]UII25914.1 hypothetical protein LVD15_21835 [Fulvivirga maritima]
MILERIKVLFYIFTVVMGLVAFSFHTATAQVEQDDEEASIPLDHFYLKPKGRGLRTFLSKFHWSFSTGYGHTFYRQDLDGFALVNQQDNGPVIYDANPSGTGGIGYNYWFNDVKTTNNIAAGPNDFTVSSDTTDLRFKAPGTSIPLNFTVHMEFDRYKIGGGVMFEYHRPGTFKPTVYEDQISSFEPDFGSAFYKKYYLILGARVYRYYEYSISVDANIGAFNLSKKFNKEVMDKGVYVNLGATFERDMSEYFKLFVRPSFDIKSFTTNMPESNLSISQSMNAAYLTFGFTYRIPELPKCFLKQCTTQVNHQHGEREYRSRMHPIYKKQNPHHGENYPTLIKYKKKNRNKLNAY